jgi:hypothetical protein
MRSVKTLILLLLACQLVNAQNSETIKEEIRNLLQQLNQARLKHDRAALEKIYAKEFINVHSSGFVDDRETVIQEIMSTDSIRALPMPRFDNLEVYGDVVVLKTLSQTGAATVNTNSLAGVYIYVKRDGRWQIAHAQGTPLQRERATITPDAAIMKSYIGKYERNPGELIIVGQEGNFLWMKLVGRGVPARKLQAGSNTEFFDKLGSSYIFSKDGANLILTTKLQGGQESKWKKIE